MPSTTPVASLSTLPRSDRPAEWATWLPQFVSICEQVADAHAEGQVHGALAPTTVGIAADDVTWLVQWPTDRTPHPGYIAPEQYRQQPLTPATDVYALGGILYYLLTGHSPIVADNPQQYVAHTLDGRVVPPQTLNPTLPESLSAVCLRALSVRLNQRYESARALAAAIPQHARPVRRWPRYVVAASLLIAFMVGVGIVGVRALRSAPTPAPVTLEPAAPLAPDFASITTARAAIDEVAETNPQTARTQRETYLASVGPLRIQCEAAPIEASEALEHLGHLYCDHEQWADAERCWKLAHKSASTPLAQARLHRALARCQLHAERFDEVEHSLQFASKAVAPLTTPDAQWELAQAHQALGDLYLRREVANAALNAYTTAHGTLVELVRTVPDRAEYALALAQVQTELACIQRTAKQRIDATASFSAAVQTLTALPADVTRRWRYQAALGRVWYEWGVHDYAAGLRAVTQEHLEQALTAQTAVLVAQPQSQPFRRTLLKTELLLGQALRRQKKWPAARSVLIAARTRCETLCAVAKPHPDDREQLGTILAQLALVEHDQMDHVAMLPLIRAAQVVRLALADEFKHSYRYGYEAAWALQWEGHTLWHLKQTDAALAVYAQACQRWEPWAKAATDYAEAALCVAETRNCMGSIYLGQKNYSAALSNFGWAEMYLLRVLRGAPRHSRLEPAVRTTLMGQSRANMAQGWYADALKKWDVYYSWNQQMPADLRIRRAICYAYLGQVTTAEAEVEAALSTTEPEAREYYNAACVFAVAARHSTVADAERRAARAVALLRAAGAAGHYTPDELQSDDDLASLRARADFRQWLHDLTHTERLPTPRE